MAETIDEFLVDFYKQKNNEDVSSEKISELKETYGSDYDSLITDLYSKYDDGGLDDNKLSVIKNDYELNGVDVQGVDAVEEVEQPKAVEEKEKSFGGKILDEIIEKKSNVDNRISNMPTQIRNTVDDMQGYFTELVGTLAGQDASDFLVGDSKITSNPIVFEEPQTGELISFEENPDKWKKLNYANSTGSQRGKIKQLYGKTGVEVGQQTKDYVVNQLKQVEERSKKLSSDIGSLVQGGKKLTSGDIDGVSDLFGGAFNAVSSMVQTIGPAMVTRGASLFPQVVTPMFRDYNIEKAKYQFPESKDPLEELKQNGDIDISVPTILGTASLAAEYIGLKGLGKYIKNIKPKNGTFVKLLGTSNKEGTTELLQTGIDQINKSLAKGSSVEQSMKDGVDVMFSEDGLESYLQGFVGSSALGGPRYIASKALRSNDESVKVINESIDNLNKLQNSINQTKSEDIKKILREQVLEVEQGLKSYVNDNNKILNTLNKDQIVELNELMSEKSNISNTYNNILDQFNNKNISSKEFGYAKRTLNNRTKAINNKINEIRNSVNLSQIEKTTKIIKEKQTELGIKINSFETSKEFAEITGQDPNVDGFYNPKTNEIFINKEKAAETGAVNVAAHELLHNVLKNEVSNPVKAKKLVDDFKNVLSDKELDIVQKRIDENYKFTTDEKGNKIELQESEYIDEYLTAFSDAIGQGDIVFNNNIFTRIGDLISSLLKKVGFKKINFEKGKDVYDFIKDYQKNISKGIVSEQVIKKSKTLEDVDGGIKASKTEDNKTIKEIFDKFTGPAENRKFKSKEEFKNSPEFFDALLEIEQSNTLDASIRNTVSEAYLDMNPGFIREVKEKISDKYRSEYDASKNSLFGWLTGKNVSGQPLINLVSGDIQIKRGKKPSTVTTTKKVGGEDSKVTVAETLVSDEISPEDYTDMKLAQDKLKKNKPQQSAIANKIGLNENELNLAKREIINFLRKTDRPAMTDSKKFFKALVDYTTGKGVQPGGFANVIYDKLSLPKNGELSTKNRESFIRKIAEDLIALNKVDPAVMRRSNWTPFYELEIKNMNPTQMQKAIDEGRIPSTSNLKSGLDLFKTLDPSIDQVTEYLMNIRPDVLKRKMPKFLAEVIVKNEFNDIVDNTTQPVYDTKGNVTDNTIDLSETVTEEEVERGAPQVKEKIARPEGIKFSKTLQNKVKKVIAESAKTKIAKEKQGINADIEKAYGGSLDHSNPDDFKKLNSDILNVFAPEFGVDIFSYTTSQTLAAAGNNAFGSKPSSGAIGAKFWYVNDLGKVTDVEKLGETTSMKEAGYIGDLTELNSTIAKKLNLKIPTPKNRIYIAKSQGLSNLEYNKKNIDTVNKEKENTLDNWKKIYDNYPKARPSIKELQYNNNANAAVSKNEAIVLDSMDGASESNKYEEHGYQHGEYSLDKARAMSSKVEGVWENWKDYAKKEYKQMVFNITTRIKSIKGDMRTYQGIVDLTYNLPEYGEWKAKSEKHPLVSEMMNIAMKTGKKSDWNKVPPASDMRFFNEVIKLNPFALKTFYNGKTVSFAEKYGLEVPKKFQNDPNVYELASDLIFEINKTKAGKLSGDLAMTPVEAQDILNDYLKLVPGISKSKTVNVKNLTNNVVSFSKTDTNQDIIGYAKTVDEALAIARDINAPVKKIRVFDFDDTLATTKSDVLFTAPDGTEGKLNAEEFAKQGSQLLEEGYVFDFSEFNKVTDGKPGPLLDIAKKIQEARGTEDVFVLTARAPEAQVAIKEFLDSVGLNIPLENITGLGNSTGAAKANWIVDKAADGYNDFYFADDAYQNVKAVRDALDQIDVKSEVQQAKIKFSKTLNEDFNKIIENTTGVAADKVYSKAKAQVRGANKGRFKFFIPYSAEDFLGLIYPTLSKSNLGDAQMAWYKKHILDPYTRAMESLSADRIQLMEDFKALKKALDVPKNLRKVNDSGFTNEQAVRVYLWNKMGYDIPGLSKTDLKELTTIVESDGLLKAFADQILNLTKGDGYSKPTDNWLVGTITTALVELINTTKRSKYLEEWKQNIDEVYFQENIKKLTGKKGGKKGEGKER